MIEHPFNVRVCAHLWEATKNENRRGHDPDHRNRFHQAIADEQLEQCIAWLDNTHCDDPQETATRLRQAMRPQEDN